MKSPSFITEGYAPVPTNYLLKLETFLCKQYVNIEQYGTWLDYLLAAEADVEYLNYDFF